MKALVEARKVRMTASAVISARLLGFTEEGAMEVVLSLAASDFYKSMTTYADRRIWQDVYQPRTVHGNVYLKLTVIEDVLIVSFKEL